MSADPGRYFGTGDGFYDNYPFLPAQVAATHVYYSAISHVYPVPPLLTKVEERKIWSREAVLRHVMMLRRYPPPVIERPRATFPFKRTTRSMASRWRVLQ